MCAQEQKPFMQKRINAVIAGAGIVYPVPLRRVSYKKIQVHCVCGNDSSRERLRNKIAESQQRRLSSMKVNWSALKAA